MKALSHIYFIAKKEWQLNLRFAFQYFVHTLVGPLRTSILMLLLYRGILPSSQHIFGVINKDNYVIWVLLGTFAHSVFTNSISTIGGKIQAEKWWQTVLALLVSPARPVSVGIGVLLGGAGFYVFISGVSLAALAIYAGTPVHKLLISILVIGVLSLYAAGFAMIQALVSICFEGKSFLFEYFMQLVIFLSCFYYPLELLPVFCQKVAVCLPTYQISVLLREIFLNEITWSWVGRFSFLAALSIPILIIPSMAYDYSLRKYGVVGY